MHAAHGDVLLDLEASSRSPSTMRPRGIGGLIYAILSLVTTSRSGPGLGPTMGPRAELYYVVLLCFKYVVVQYHGSTSVSSHLPSLFMYCGVVDGYPYHTASSSLVNNRRLLPLYLPEAGEPITTRRSARRSLVLWGTTGRSFASVEDDRRQSSINEAASMAERGAIVRTNTVIPCRSAMASDDRMGGRLIGCAPSRADPLMLEDLGIRDWD